MADDVSFDEAARQQLMVSYELRRKKFEEKNTRREQKQTDLFGGEVRE